MELNELIMDNGMLMENYYKRQIYKFVERCNDIQNISDEKLVDLDKRMDHILDESYGKINRILWCEFYDIYAFIHNWNLNLFDYRTKHDIEELYTLINSIKVIKGL